MKLLRIPEHTRRAPQRPSIDDPLHTALKAEVAEIAIERAIREFADEFPADCWRDPVFRATGGLF